MTKIIDEKLNCIIRTFPSAQVKILLETKESSNSIKKIVEKNTGDFFGRALQYAAVKIEAIKIKNLVTDKRIQKIWYIDSRIFEPYFHVLKGVEKILSLSGTPDLPAVVNMSLGPPIERPGMYYFNPDEPFNFATKKLSEAGIVVVVAVGNSGRMGNNTINPWSVAPWVIGVGAATKDAKKLADFSSRGIPDHQLYKPTIVGPGVDIESLGEIISGTSFATANIGAAVGTIVAFLRKHFGFKDIGGVRTFEFRGPKICELDISYESYKKTIKFEVGTPASLSPNNIKKLLTKLALPMKNYKQHEVGAGFFSKELAAKYFDDYSGNRVMRINIM